MDIIKRNQIFLKVCVCILALCGIYHLLVYFIVSAPRFTEPVSVKIIGNGDEYFFLEMQWIVENQYHIPYKLSFSDANFYDGDSLFGDIDFSEDIMRVGMFSRTVSTLTATLQRSTFAKMMSDGKSAVSFHLIADGQIQNLFFDKQLIINQFLPINVYQLLNDFLTEEYQKNLISIDKESVRFEDAGDHTIMTCDIHINNRGGLDLRFTALEDGRVSINRHITGAAISFTPVNFRPNQEVHSARINFYLNERIDRSMEIGYMITGKLKVSLWNRVFLIPILLVG